MKSTEALAVLMSDAPTDEDVAHARAANLDAAALHRAAAAAWETVAAVTAGLGAAVAAFEPGPPTPVQPAAHTLTRAEERIVQRSIAGDDEDATPRLPSLAGFLAAAAASGDWGVPVRSSCDPDRFGKGAMRGGGGRPHDPHAGRERYALAERELRRIADSEPQRYGLTGPEQMAVWCAVAGAGALGFRNIRDIGGAARERAEQKATASAAPKSKRRRATMEPPQKRKLVLVPEREKHTGTSVALFLREQGVYTTPHQVGLVCRALNARVREAFEVKGWIARAAKREEIKSANSAEGEAIVAAPEGWDLSGWKDILPIVGLSEGAARAASEREKDPLPVRVYFGTVIAKRAEVLAWIGRQTVRRTA